MYEPSCPCPCHILNGSFGCFCKCHITTYSAKDLGEVLRQMRDQSPQVTIKEPSATEIVLADLEGNFLEFNNWWPKMTGYTEEEFSQMKNFSLAHPDELEISKMRKKKEEKEKQKELLRVGCTIWVIRYNRDKEKG